MCWDRLVEAFCIGYGSTVGDVAAGFRRKGWGSQHAMTFGNPIGLLSQWRRGLNATHGGPRTSVTREKVEYLYHKEVIAKCL
jgi:hypothetical protein